MADAQPRPGGRPDKGTPAATRCRSSALPVPRPLPMQVAAGVFGLKEHGQPVRPGSDVVRTITEAHAEKIVGLIADVDQAKRAISSAPPSGTDRLTAERDRLRAGYVQPPRRMPRIS